MWAFALAFLASCTLWAQEANVRGPVTGIVYDEQTRSIRAILGLPGASHLGEPLVEHLDFAGVAPNGERAIGVREGKLHLVTLGADTAWRTLVEEYPGASRASWSADSKSVAVLGASGLALYRRLDAEPESIALGQPEGILALRILEDGSGALYSSAAGVYLATGLETKLVAAFENPTSLTIDGTTAYAASRARNEVISISHFADTASVAIVANQARGIVDPAGLAMVNGELLVASGSARALHFVNTTTGEIRTTANLGFEPDRLDLFSRAPEGRALYSLNARDSQQSPLQFFDVADSRVFFVPAASQLARRQGETLESGRRPKP